jgi:hypothetical protein
MKHIFVVGPAEAGKSTVARAIAKTLACPLAECGEQIATELTGTLFSLRRPRSMAPMDPDGKVAPVTPNPLAVAGVQGWAATRTRIVAHKQRDRALWRAYGDFMVAHDAAIWVRTALWRASADLLKGLSPAEIDSKHVVVCGVRRAAEFEAYREEFARHEPFVVLVTRPHFDVSQDSFDLEYFSKRANFKVTNAGDASVLQTVGEGIAEGMRAK